MVSRDTVLVLGAGASVPYGFPTGRGLLDDVLATLESEASNSGKHEYYQLVAEVSREPASIIQEFAAELRKPGHESIDAFLATRQEFAGVGKVAMAVELLHLERENRLSKKWSDSHKSDGPWYNVLWQNVRAPNKEQFSENKLSIITFNYDRSIEAYLHMMIESVYSLSSEAALDYLDYVEIVHVHGDLLPFSLKESMLGRPFGPSENPDVIAAAADRIVVQFEDADMGPRQRAKDLLAKAKVIGVMGFGYAEQNVERLAFRSTVGNPNLHLLGFDLLGRELELAQNAIRKHWRAQDTRFALNDLPVTGFNCETFLRQYPVLA